MAAMMVGAMDQQPANASGAHFGKGDLLAGRAGTAVSKRGLIGQANEG